MLHRLLELAGEAVSRLAKRLGPSKDASSGGVLRSMLVLAFGTGTGKLIGIVTIPVITRIYAPEQFGLYSLFLASTAFLSPFSTLRYAAAMPLPRRDDTALNLMVGSLLVLLLSSIVAAAVISTVGPTIFHWLSTPDLGSIWIIMLGSTAIAGCYELLYGWNLRKTRFKSIAKGEVTNSVSSGLLKIGMGAIGMLKVGLTLSHVTGQVLGCAVLTPEVYRDAAPLRRRIKLRTMLAALARYADFPKYRLPSHLLLGFSAQAPLFFISKTYGSAMAGQFGLALTVLAIPATMVIQTASQAYYAEIARIGPTQPHRILTLSVEVCKKLLLLGIGPAAGLMLLGPFVFKIAFGARWAQAGVFCQILSIYLLGQFVAVPVSNALNVFSRQRLQLVLDIVRVVAVIGAIYVCTALGLTYNATVGAYSAALLGYYLFNCYIVFSIIRRESSASSASGAD